MGNFRVIVCAWLGILFTGAASAGDAAPATFIYQHDVGAGDDRNQYGLRVLLAALDHTREHWGDYEVKPSAPMPGKHRIYVLEHGEGGVNIGLFVNHAGLDHRLIPVRIPIDRGMLGYRVLVIRTTEQPRFDAIASLDDLKAIRFGLLDWWEDVPIMRDAGLAVVPGTSFEGLFHMLKAHRFDALSRGAGEVEPEMADRRTAFPGLAIERHLLLHYPMPVYFWFPATQDGRDRAERVREGLQAMERDGSLAELFLDEFGPMIRDLDLDHRHVIELPNPLLDGKDPVDDRSLWYSQR